ncbi:ComK protein [Candidatus Izimaplasma bacterium HR1]|jgi:competence protein ComK|uniref:competence protein ComK n=1 Tax=Candidatus Izimoplasma sp. HR1 TaxID=1541959 RepID=UPI0004F7EE36|nr:ComK protein [Candidatus Izimaplasma bacterium HR1]
MKYVKRATEGILVLDKKAKYLTKGLKQYINDQCIKNLSTFEGREQAARIILNLKSNLPIYVNDEIILFPTKSMRNYDCIYVNYHKVLSFRESLNGFTKIIFSDLTEIEVDASLVKIKRQLLRAQTIFELKNAY